MHISVVGSGYVGLVTGTCFAEFGVDVTCVDNDASKIEGLKQGRIPIYEPGLEELVERNLKAGRLHFTTDLKAGVEKALAVFIAVGTPPREDGSADLRYVDEVAEAIGRNLNGYKVVVTKSTVPIGTGERVRGIIERHNANGARFDVVSNPEFLREGSAIEDFMRPDRVVIGADSDQAVAIMRDLYAPLYLIETPIVITNVASSEMIKYASNAFLATKISFINEMAEICERVGADVHQVAKGMGLDKRINPKFLHPGPGYGGSCFPKDTSALVQIAGDHGYRLRIVEAVLEVNKERRAAMVAKMQRLLPEFSGRTIAALGLAFKPNTDDVRDSPALDILLEAQRAGARLRVFDPAAMETSRPVLGERGVTWCADAYEAAAGADLLVLFTEWNQFRNLDLDRLKELLAAPRIVDCRNIYDPKRMRAAGFEYLSVGR
ncbi:MAG TPA: UDP-glucose/GDP-mannose dehydrogenase family protein [bacterium]